MNSQQGAGGEGLLPCPFCASGDVKLHQVVAGGGWGVLCRTCHTYQDTRTPEQGPAIAAWNRRHPSGHTGGPVAWLVEWDHKHEPGVKAVGGGSTIIRNQYAAVEAKVSELSAMSWVAEVKVTPLGPIQPAAQQDGGSGGGEAVGAAEPEVGRAVYERIESLMDKNPAPGTSEWIELDYLSHLAESVEEVGGYDGPLSALQSAHPASDSDALHFIFDGPPGPEAPRFIEVETPSGQSVSAGEWSKREDGRWVLTVSRGPQKSRAAHEAEQSAIRAIVHSTAHPASGAEDAGRAERAEAALKKAEKALQGALEWDKARGYRMPYRVRDPIYAVLDDVALAAPSQQEGSR